MPTPRNISPNNTNRRNFLGTGLKLGGLALLFLPFQKVWADSSAFIAENAGRARRFLYGYSLVLNKKTHIVHLVASQFLFSTDQPIAAENREAIDPGKWESRIKKPVHLRFNRSGIILEVLALHKLAGGITDKNLAAAINTLSMAFAADYKNSDGKLLNKYNFRLHELLVQLIALNTGMPVATKWKAFQAATGNTNYSIQLQGEKKLPGRVAWMKTRESFDKRASYILADKITYTDRLKERIADNTFS